ELQKIAYTSVTQVVAGSVRQRPQINYETVARVAVSASADRPVRASFTPPAAGSYRIRAKLAQDKTGASIADWQIWVSGDTSTYWGDRFTNNRLNVRLDKDKYQPGETATALIESPYDAGELYFAVIRDGILYEETMPVSGSAPRVQFEVTPDMLPNAAVEAVLVRQGEPLLEVEAGSLDNLVKVGFAPFQVDLSDRYLTVDVGVAESEIAPGTQQTVELQLKTDRGTPTQGQITLMVVNEAILQLSGYRPPDLVDLVYATQPIATRFSDNRPDVTLEELSSPLTKGWGYGGGRSGGSAGTELRTDFRPLAYFNGSLVTDEDGRARASFELPDDLTTWRVMAVATDGEFHFGNNVDATFLTTKPLLVNPLLPQFVRPGDRFLGGLALTNTTDKVGALEINANLTGPITLDDRAKINRQLSAGTAGYRLMMAAISPGTATIQFNVLAAELGDAFAVPLSVKPHAVTEQAIATGVTQDRATVPLNIDRDVDPQTGGLEVSLAGTLVPELVAPARQTFAEESLPCLGPLVNQLSIAASLQQLPQDFADFNPTQQANTAIEKLLELQQPDGGFASWPQAKGSNPYLTPEAARSLARARAAGFTVPPTAIANVRQYLNRKLASPDCESILCKIHTRLDILLAFVELGDRRSDFLADLYAQRETMAPLDRLRLARLLLQQPGWEQEAREWSDTLLQETNETGRSATLSLPESWSWLQSAAATQAEGLQLAIARELPREKTDPLVQGLLNLRREGTWRNSYDNARALQALVTYSQTIETVPNFTATAKLNRQELLSAQFQGRRAPSQTTIVPTEELSPGKRDLIFSKSGTGDLHYAAAYRYRLQGRQPGRFQGLRVTREVRRANNPEVIRRYGLYEKGTGFKIPTGEVYEIDLEIVTDRPVHHVAIQDPLPAGLEAIDTQFQTTNPAIQVGADSWEIDYQRIHRDRIVAYADFLVPGVYHLNYLVRSVTPGIYSWPGAEAKLQYEPEQFGRTAASILEIEMRSGT
ncbi:MAG: alpha-2-macroglobulin family protein, partial [Cyanobacteria bacterium J06641_5]